MRKAPLALAGAVVAIAAVCLVRAFTLQAPPSADAESPIDLSRNRESIAKNLSQAIRFETVSWGDARERNDGAFAGFASFLERTYPAAHGAMDRETVGGHSLLYRWPGTDGSARPVAFLAHIDVVPVEPGTEREWTHPPFSGAIADGAVWGRGALDNKGQIIALLEAAESLAAQGFRPSGDVYFLFGHDEEVGGPEGAAAIAVLLNERGARLAWTLDEGSGLVDGLIPGAPRPVALIAMAEKGYVTLKFSATAAGGHSSAPGPDTAVSLVSRAVVAVTENPYKLELDGNIVAFLHALAPELSFPRKVALANLWLTGGLIKSAFAENPTLAASMRTTTAPTMIGGGTKTNILPQRAEAYVNYRIHPRDSVESVVARAVRLIGDARVTVEALEPSEPSPQSSRDSDGYRALEASVRAVFGAVAVAPSLTLQGTDTKNYVAANVADDYYRFTPFIYRTDDLKRIHGTDERVMVDDLVRATAFYEDLIRRIGG